MYMYTYENTYIYIYIYIWATIADSGFAGRAPISDPPSPACMFNNLFNTKTLRGFGLSTFDVVSVRMILLIYLEHVLQVFLLIL